MMRIRRQMLGPVAAIAAMSFALVAVAWVGAAEGPRCYCPVPAASERPDHVRNSPASERPDHVGNSPAEGLRYYYAVPAAEPARTVEAEVVVYGGTPGGVMAAIQARRMGKTAVLVEFGRHVGGMTAGGLSKTDGGKHAAGISREF